MRLPEHVLGLVIFALVAVFVLFHVLDVGLPGSFSPQRATPLTEPEK